MLTHQLAMQGGGAGECSASSGVCTNSSQVRQGRLGVCALEVIHQPYHDVSHQENVALEPIRLAYQCRAILTFHPACAQDGCHQEDCEYQHSQLESVEILCHFLVVGPAREHGQ